MNATRWLVGAGLAVLVLLPAAMRGGDEIPTDAQKLVEDFDREAQIIQEKADKEIKVKKEKLIERLKQLQDTYCRAAKLDEAVAIRDKIRLLKAAVLDMKPDPGNLVRFRDMVGKGHIFEVTGRTTGGLWGTGVYTDDSTLAAAAVHAGVLKDGQKGLVKVTLLKGETAYIGSTNNGVTSFPFGEYPSGSYRVDPVE